MTDLIVIVPSRGRPEAAKELAEAFKETCTADTQLMVAIDDNDPDRGLYELKLMGTSAAMSIGNSRTMVESLNQTALLTVGDHFALGFMGDDHRPRTIGWDSRYLEELHKLGTGIVYGNDLLQGHKLPTQCAMTSNIVKALGYMAPPSLTHMYVDNFWLSIGRAAGCIRYLPNVTVEHMHPLIGKSEWTEGHKRVNAQEMYDHDAAAFNEYGSGQFFEDATKVRDLAKVKL